MSIIEFFESAIGTTNNEVLFCLAAFFVLYVSVDFFHVLYQSVFSWFKK